MRTALLFVLAIGAFGFFGCQRHAVITHAKFQVSDFQGSTKTVQGKLKNVRLRLDRKAKKLTLIHASGTEEVVSFKVRPGDQWMRGCPGFGSTRMEVIDLGVPQVVIGRFTIQKPVLQAASCRSGSGFLLREASQVQTVSHWTCKMAQLCLRFMPMK